ncbi:MAG TPA: EamA family transporter, partial [Pseudomonadales bacterium]|nr:EamA family transporter [Pseudomonadales bacterium]
MNGQRISGILAALAAALLFGASTPLAKLLLTRIDPWLLAALLYLGSGVGLWLLRRLGRAEAVRLERGDWGWLAAAIAAGGVAAPLLLMFALSAMPATTAALLLNAEAVLTV